MRNTTNRTLSYWSTLGRWSHIDDVGHSQAVKAQTIPELLNDGAVAESLHVEPSHTALVHELQRIRCGIAHLLPQSVRVVRDDGDARLGALLSRNDDSGRRPLLGETAAEDRHGPWVSGEVERKTSTQPAAEAGQVVGRALSPSVSAGARRGPGRARGRGTPPAPGRSTRAPRCAPVRPRASAARGNGCCCRVQLARAQRGAGERRVRERLLEQTRRPAPVDARTACAAASRARASASHVGSCDGPASARICSALARAPDASRSSSANRAAPRGPATSCTIHSISTPPSARIRGGTPRAHRGLARHSPASNRACACKPAPSAAPKVLPTSPAAVRTAASSLAADTAPPASRSSHACCSRKSMIHGA